MSKEDIDELVDSILATESTELTKFDKVVMGAKVTKNVTLKEAIANIHKRLRRLEVRNRNNDLDNFHNST